MAGTERQRAAQIAGQRLVPELCARLVDEFYDSDEHRRDPLSRVQSVADRFAGAVQESGDDRIYSGVGRESGDHPDLSDRLHFVQQAHWCDCRAVLPL